MIQNIVQKALKTIATLILKRYKPKIIAITGSVGKTSTKYAINLVLKESYRVQMTEKNYNNEYGVPLTIIGIPSPGKSIRGWVTVFLKGFSRILFKDKTFPEIFILEYGTDRPGDIAYLRDMAPPHVAIITHVGSAHMEFFGSRENIAKEKVSLIKNCNDKNLVIVNGDNEFIENELKTYPDVHTISYGFGENAALRVYGKRVRFEKGSRTRPLGIGCSIRFKGEEKKMFLPGVLSDAHIYAVLPALIIADRSDIDMDTAIKKINHYHVPPGRMKLLRGIKNTLLIDDTYNASPEAVVNALDTLDVIPVMEGGSKWAVLGDMLELGSESEEEHKKIGKAVLVKDVDYLITVGVRAKSIAKRAKRAGMSKERVFSFDDTKNAGLFLQDRMKERDIILVKGSAMTRMEKIVKEVMADPLRAKDLLVRQEQVWNT